MTRNVINKHRQRLLVADYKPFARVGELEYRIWNKEGHRRRAVIGEEASNGESCERGKRREGG